MLGHVCCIARMSQNWHTVNIRQTGCLTLSQNRKYVHVTPTCIIEKAIHILIAVNHWYKLCNSQVAYNVEY